ncbi:metal-dependent hydrolase [Brevibacillus laterosporus]|uniref:metal-dependent hydrolase n=1 Tax=Brevibacillus laterosporus TaxID=1465 RepID=UPI003D2159E9
MKYKTHIAFSTLAGVCVAKFLDIPFQTDYVMGVAVGSLLPDIDHPKSYIGKKLSKTSRVMSKTLGHRGLTHALPFWLCLFPLGFFMKENVFLGLWIGYLFHIVGDLLTVAGVPLFYPFSKARIKLPLAFKTGSSVEKGVFIACLLLIIVSMDANMFAELNSSLAIQLQALLKMASELINSLLIR